MLSAPTSVTGISTENNYWSSTFGKASQYSAACMITVGNLNASVRQVRAF